MTKDEIKNDLLTQLKVLHDNTEYLMELLDEDDYFHMALYTDMLKLRVSNTERDINKIISTLVAEEDK